MYELYQNTTFCHFLAILSQDLYILDITDIIGCVCNDLLFKENIPFYVFCVQKR